MVSSHLPGETMSVRHTPSAGSAGVVSTHRRSVMAGIVLAGAISTTLFSQRDVSIHLRPITGPSRRFSHVVSPTLVGRTLLSRNRTATKILNIRGFFMGLPSCKIRSS